VIDCNSQNETAPLKKVTLCTQWLPQAQFAGFYVAQEKGFYSKYGIDIRIIDGSAFIQVHELLESGEATFGTMRLVNAVQHKAYGLDIINISQLMSVSPLMIIAKKSKIKKIEDLNGKTIGVWEDSHSFFKGFLKTYKLKANIVTMSASVNLFLLNGVDAMAAMEFNEFDQILSSGFKQDEFTIFRIRDLGYDFPEDGIYCMKEIFQNDPELCRNFILATYEGWKFAFDNNEEAIEIVLKHIKRVGTQANRTHQRWMLKKMKEYYYNGSDLRKSGNFSFSLNEKKYMDVCYFLYSQKIIAQMPPISSFYVNLFKKQ